MIPDISLNGTSLRSLGWLRESINFPTPKSQSESITVPGRNSPIRYTEALGRVSYQPRTFDFTLTMLGSRSKFNAMVDSLVNSFSGHLVKVICSEEPTLYSVGTLEADTDYNPRTGKDTVVFSCEDGDAYRYHVQETIVTVPPAGQLRVFTLQNDYMPVVPTIITSGETVLTWKVGTDSFHKTISAGTWVFPELELQHGANTISITSSGNTTFRFREGRL